MRQTAKRCPLCKIKLIDTPYRPASKELDHILPLGMGGSHTYANTRIICRNCNEARPKDGSDQHIQLGIWDEHVFEITPPNLRSEWKAARRAGRNAMIRSRRRQRPTHSWYPSTDLTDTCIRILHSSGLGQKAIARRTGFSRARIKSAYRRLELPPHL